MGDDGSGGGNHRDFGKREQPLDVVVAVFEFGIVPSEDSTERTAAGVRSLDGGVVEADDGAGG